MVMKGYSALPKALALVEPHHQIVLCHIQDTFGRGSYPSAEMPSVYSIALAKWTLLQKKRINEYKISIISVNSKIVFLIPFRVADEKWLLILKKRKKKNVLREFSSFRLYLHVVKKKMSYLKKIVFYTVCQKRKG